LLTRRWAGGRCPRASSSALRPCLARRHGHMEQHEYRASQREFGLSCGPIRHR